jgi:hypothetical protein
MSLGPLPLLGIAVVLLWLAGAWILRTIESEARRRPLFVAWLFWRWTKRRR